VLTNATVILHSRDNGARISARTNENGEYRFERLAPGTYIVTVEAAGFSRPAQELLIEENKATALGLQLAIAGLDDQVVVTATGTAQAEAEVSKAVTVVGEGEIGLRDEYSVAESLRVVPGLRVQQLGGPGSLTAIRTRGLRNEDTAVLIDGMRFRDAATTQGDATTFLSDLLFINTDRLEILRGSGSSVYGTNAIGGVINVITDAGGGRPRGEVQVEGGGLGFFRGRAKIAGDAGGDRLRYSAGLAHLNVPKGVDGNDAARNTSGQGMVQYNFTPSHSLTARVFAGDSFVQLNDAPFAVPAAAGFQLPPAGTPVRAVAPSLSEHRRLEAEGRPFTSGSTPAFVRDGANFIPALDDPDWRRSACFFSGALAFAGRLSRRGGYRVSYQRVATSRTFSDGPAGLRFEPQFNSESESDGRIDTVEARTHFQLGLNNFLTSGYEFERETYASRARDENPDPARRVGSFTGISQLSHAFFAQDQLRLFGGRLQFAAAVRAQAFRLSRPEFLGGAPRYAGIEFQPPPAAVTGDGAVSYFFRSTNTKLRAHAGNGYRAPSLFERFGSSFSAGTFSPFGDPRLSPDRSAAFDAGADQTLAGGRVQASATYFYTRLQEVIFFEFPLNPAADPFGRSSGYINTGGGLARGLELSLVATPTASTHLNVSYTSTNADQRRPQVPGYLPSLGVSDHLFTLAATHRIGRLDLTFDIFAASDYAVNFSNRPFIFDGPVKAALGVSYTLTPKNERPSLRLYGKVENIFDRQYLESGFRAPGAFFVGGTSLRF
jgi:vitamin B12 transporter